MFLNLTEVLTNEDKVIPMRTEAGITEVSVGGESYPVTQCAPDKMTYANYNVYGLPANELFDENGKWTGNNPLPGYTDLDW